MLQQVVDRRNVLVGNLLHVVGAALDLIFAELTGFLEAFRRSFPSRRMLRTATRALSANTASELLKIAAALSLSSGIGMRRSGHP
jgi:hypothetical protein